MVIAGADLAEAERASDRERFRLFGLSAVAQLSGIILTPAVRSIVSRHAAGKAVAAADLDERQCRCRAREVWCAGSLLVGHVTTADDRNQEGSGTDIHLHECSRKSWCSRQILRCGRRQTTLESKVCCMLKYASSGLGCRLR